jgi:transcriptional regulator with XRE-family HTH domain
MKIINTHSNQAVLTELGERITRRRLDLQLTQAMLAKEAGVGKSTVERIEAGNSAQLASLVSILRVLDLFANLDQLIPETAPGPLDMLKRKGKPRQRASSGREPERAEEPWSWDE